MGKNITKYELVADERARRVTFRKRTACLFRKLNELTTLCGTTAAAVILSPCSPEPDFWPSASTALDVFEKFKILPAKKRDKNAVDQKKFLRGRVSKLQEKLEKQKRKNLMLLNELRLLPDSASGIALNRIENSDDISNIFDEYVEFIDKKMEQVKIREAEKNATTTRA